MTQAEAGHPEYLKILDEMRELHCRKAADYGRGVDPLANVRAGADFGIPAWVGVMIRANDKMHRIKSFLQNGSLKNESVEDSLKDLAAYALIALVLYREQAHESGSAATRSGRLRVYIAGPISKGDLGANISQAAMAGLRLLKAGLAPLVPHLTCYLGEASAPDLAMLARPETLTCGTTPTDWYEADLPWVDVADAVLRLPGESVGADLETQRAADRGIPVFTAIEDVIQWSQSRSN